MELQEVEHKRYSTEDKINHFAKALPVIESCERCKSEFLSAVGKEGHGPHHGPKPNVADDDANTHTQRPIRSECYND